MDSRLLIIAVVAYLLGSIPFGYILVRLFLKQDIRQTGSGNIGATNVARSGKKGLAIATLLLDAGKGAAAVVAAAIIAAYLPRDSSSSDVISSTQIHNAAFIPLEVAALCAILGHCFPVWLRFKGGKGVATAVGAFLMIAPKAAFLSIAAFATVFAATRYVSLSSIASAAAFPILVNFTEPWLFTLLLLNLRVASSAILILKHHGNIRRLIAGTEPKFGGKTIGTDPIQTEKSI